VGAAWVVKGTRQARLTPFLGPEPGAAEDGNGLGWRPLDIAAIADRLLRGQVGALCTGRSEAGPRALGHRSILAVPSPVGVRDHVNSLKRRESWRPFGPVALGKKPQLWSDVGELDRFMVGAAALTLTGQNTVPAVAHVDGTTRLQRVDPEGCDVLTDLLTELSNSGVEALLNTSFNGPGEPIVQSAPEAVTAAQRLGLNFLVLEDRMAFLQNR
jgi:carbamoyltransferase